MAYADALLEKIDRVEASGRFAGLLSQFCTAREAGDFRGRVLEVNFAELFVRKGHDLIYGARQGMTGDIDFRWNVAGREMFIEMKLLGQHRNTKAEINRQLERTSLGAMHIDNDLPDVVRLQRDIIQKATTRKFHPNPSATALNIVAVDVSELQLGTVDIADCLLAAGGNAVVSRYFDAAYCREGIVGVFESIPDTAGTEQNRWVAEVHKVSGGEPHPRQYIHAAMFLFRKPRETAALSYKLASVIVWNAALVRADVARAVELALHEVLPREVA